MNLDLFSNQFNKPQEIELKDASLVYYPSFFKDSRVCYESLVEEIDWRQDQIKMFGKEHNIPRLHAWYADPNVNYSYSNIALPRHDWTSSLSMLNSEIQNLTKESFNGCLCNLYRDGGDYAAWHADDEASLGEKPFIASASFGETRKFVLKHKFDKGVEKFELLLEDASLLIMKGSTQKFWLHQLSKTTKKVAPRINLTFRKII